MSVALYDEALVSKLRSWTRDTQVSVLTPDDTRSLFAINADTRNDAPIELPIIALKRPGDYTILGKRKKPLSFSGMRLEANSSASCLLNAIPISIPYQLDIYTRYQHEADEYVRNLVYNIINYPRIDIVIPYNDKNYLHYAHMRLDGEVNNLSAIPERLVQGQFTRQSLRFTVDDAYLFDVKYKDVKKIIPVGVCPQCDELEYHG